MTNTEDSDYSEPVGSAWPVRWHLGSLLDRLERLFVGRPDPNDLSTGLPALDEAVGSLRAGTVTVIGGHPGTGKSSLALTIASHAAVQKKRPALVFSLQHTAADLVDRLVACEARVHFDRFRTGRLFEGDWSRIGNAISRLADVPLFIDDTPTLTIDDVWCRAKWMRDRHGPGLVVVDCAQLIEQPHVGDGGRGEAPIGRRFRAMARELDAVVVVVYQMPPELDEPNESPRGSDFENVPLLETGDVVMALSAAKSQPRPPGSRQATVVKCLRRPIGGTASVTLEWTPRGAEVVSGF